MIIPPYLKKNDVVGIVCTAKKYMLDELHPTIELLKQWELVPVIGHTIGKEYYQFGGSDQERALDFQAMLDNPEIKAIWCARGGYGTVRMIDLVDFSHFKKNPKWIIGFSDITVLHSHINNMEIASIHAIMPINLSTSTSEALESLYKSLFNQTLEYYFPIHPYNRCGVSEGMIVGGNLSVLYSLLGSRSAINFSNKILFIEDIDEYLYHIDRMMMNFKRNGFFEGLRGLIIGGMTNMHDNTIPWGKDVFAIIKDITSEYNFPIGFRFPAGHIENNRALIFGKKVFLEINQNKSILKFL